MTIADLIAAAQGGDDQAMAEVCRRFEPLVQGQARMNHIRPLAEEAKGEARLALVQAVRLYDAASGVPAEGFIAARVRFAVWNVFKRERRRWQSEESLIRQGEAGEELRDFPAEADAAAGAVQAVLGTQVLALLPELPPREGEMIRQVYLEGMTLQEAGRLSGVSHQAAHKSCVSGIKRLRRLLGVECGG